jgi:hypothetical protein
MFVCNGNIVNFFQSARAFSTLVINYLCGENIKVNSYKNR